MGTIKKTEKLEHLSVVEIKGDDSAEFLQGQMTQDIYSIEDSKASVTSILNPQGRIISTAFVFKWGESFILILNNQVVFTVFCTAGAKAFISKFSFAVHAGNFRTVDTRLIFGPGFFH